MALCREDPRPARGWTVVLSLEWARTSHGKCALGLTVTPTCLPWLWCPSDASGQPESRHSGHTLFTFYLVPMRLFLLCSVCANSRTTADPELTRASPRPGPGRAERVGHPCSPSERSNRNAMGAESRLRLLDQPSRAWRASDCLANQACLRTRQGTHAAPTRIWTAWPANAYPVLTEFHPCRPGEGISNLSRGDQSRGTWPSSVEITESFLCTDQKVGWPLPLADLQPSPHLQASPTTFSSALLC